MDGPGPLRSGACAARPREDGPRAGTQGNQQPQTRHRERLGTGPAPQLLMQL